jgi:tetratricopeptide (TPR) repeat protein
MHRLAFGILTLLVFAPALPADEPPKNQAKEPASEKPKATPAEQLRALQQELNKEQQSVFQELRKAGSPAAQQKIIQEKYFPLEAKYAPKLLELAEKYPEDPVAITALAQALQRIPRAKAAEQKKLSERAEKVFQQAFAKDPSNKQWILLTQMLGRVDLPATVPMLRHMLEKSKQREVQGFACMALADHFKQETEKGDLAGNKTQGDQQAKQAEELYQRVVKEFNDIERYRGMTLGKLAKGDLEELRHLRIGMVAPQIKGDDVDEKKFQLTDYRGKVVLLDFWGNW